MASDVGLEVVRVERVVTPELERVDITELDLVPTAEVERVDTPLVERVDLTAFVPATRVVLDASERPDLLVERNLR